MLNYTNVKKLLQNLALKISSVVVNQINVNIYKLLPSNITQKENNKLFHKLYLL